MSHLQIVCTAFKLRNLQKKLIEEKENAVKLSKKQDVKLSVFQKLNRLGIRTSKKIRKFFRDRFSCKGTFCYKSIYKCRKDGSFENFLLKSVVGFVCGYFLTYLLFIIFVFQLHYGYYAATLFCAIVGVILMVGMAFSKTVRCVVLLTLPQLFSEKGRQALIAYALVLALTGPARNTLNNMGILNESLACGQEQLKAAVRQILDVVKRPFVAIKNAIKKVVKVIKVIVKKIKEILIKIKRIIMSILKVIKAAFMFLAKIMNVCNKELGTPFQRCSRVFEKAIVDCNAKLGPWFSWLCSITYIVKAVCWATKPLDYICMLVDFISDSIIGVIIRKVKNFVRQVKTMFYVRIKFSHSFKFESNASQSWSTISKSMVNEIKARGRSIVAFFSFVNFAASLFFLIILIRVLYYRYKFLTSERFDNKFITMHFFEIDIRRASMEKETVLPLNDRERDKYIRVGSKRLVKTEKRNLMKSVMVLATATYKIGSHIVIDYSLFWIMNLIVKYGRFQSKLQAPNIPQLHIAGTGLFADLLRGIVNAFKPLNIKLEIDTIPCLPHPIPPDYDRYVEIAITLAMCWILTILEPYGLRWRHSIMCYYHPRRARERSVWLYNHIIRQRSSFLKFARRQLRRKLMGDTTVAKITFLEYIRAHINNPCLLYCLPGSDTEITCIFCGEPLRDETKIIRCNTPGCTATYCEQCFEDLKNLCTVCLSPIDYGDYSDVSEEFDSSEDEQTKKEREARRKQRKQDMMTDTEDEHPDSDYDTGGETTDYSTGYQYADKEPIDENEENYEGFKDVEKQEVPDYASMESFRDDFGEDRLKSSTSVTSGEISAKDKQVLIDLSEDIISDTKAEKPKLKRKYIRCPGFSFFKKCSKKVSDEIPLMEDKGTMPKESDLAIQIDMSDSDIDDKDDMSIIKPEVDDNFIKLEDTKELSEFSSPSESDDDVALIKKPPKKKQTPKPITELNKIKFGPSSEDDDVSAEKYPQKYFSESSLDSDILKKLKEDLEPSEPMKKKQDLVPPLDLSSITKEPKKDKKFDVSYDVISERSVPSDRTGGLSSEESRILRQINLKEKKKCVCGPEKPCKFFLAKHLKDGRTVFEPMEFEKKKKFKENVRNYYKNIRSKFAGKESMPRNHQKKHNKIMKYMKKMLPKAKKPLEDKHSVEVKSYNYTDEQWDTLGSDFSSPISPIDKSAREQSNSSEKESSIEKEPSPKPADHTKGCSCPKGATVCNIPVSESIETLHINPEIKDNRIRGGAEFFEQSFENRPLSLISSQFSTSVDFLDILGGQFIPPPSLQINLPIGVTLEDLTPTKDCDDISMSSKRSKISKSGTGHIFKNPAQEHDSEFNVDSVREDSPLKRKQEYLQPQKDSSLKRKQEYLQTQKESISERPVGSKYLDHSKASKDTSSSSSELSEETCANILGFPKKVRLCKVAKEYKKSLDKLSLDEYFINSETYVLNEITGTVDKSSSALKASSYDSQKSITKETSKTLASKEKSKNKSLQTLQGTLDKQSKNKSSQIPQEKTLKQPTGKSKSSQIPQVDKQSSAKVKAKSSHFKTPSFEQAAKSLSKHFEERQQTKLACYCNREAIAPKSCLCKKDTQEANENDKIECDCSQKKLDKSIQSLGEKRNTQSQFNAKQGASAQTSKVMGKSRSDNRNSRHSPRDLRHDSNEVGTQVGSIVTLRRDEIESKSRLASRTSKKDESPDYYQSSTKRFSSNGQVAKQKSRSAEYAGDRDHKKCCSCKKKKTHSPKTKKRDCRCGDYEYDDDDVQSEHVICVPQSSSKKQRKKCNCGDQPTSHKPRKPKNDHQCCPCESSSSSSSEESECCECTNVSSLPYQDNNEYLELVHELEDKLMARNRNRVRKAMMEFETKSSQNRNLDRPILNDSNSSEDEPILSQLKNIKANKRRICPRYQPNQMCQPCRPNIRPPPPRCLAQRRYSASPNKGVGGASSHWQLDEVSGEWYKVSGGPGSCCYRSRTPSPSCPCHNCQEY